jgi:hypothetical protein
MIHGLGCDQKVDVAYQTFIFEKVQLALASNRNGILSYGLDMNAYWGDIRVRVQNLI